jgi:hypothetical protein
MILLTPELREQLANGRDRDVDHVPVVKFFNPLGEGVWLATELDADGDTLFGLADLGEPELGSFSLAEMIAVRLPLGLGIERDISSRDCFRSRSGPKRRGEPAASGKPSAYFTPSIDPSKRTADARPSRATANAVRARARPARKKRLERMLWDP